MEKPGESIPELLGDRSPREVRHKAATVGATARAVLVYRPAALTKITNACR
jgi:hypothetical protein